MFYKAAIFVKYCSTTGSWCSAYFEVKNRFSILTWVACGSIPRRSLFLTYHSLYWLYLLSLFPSLSNFRSKGKFLKSCSGKNVVISLQLLSKRWYFPHMDRAIVAYFIWKIPVAKLFQDPKCSCRLRILCVCVWPHDINKLCVCNELKKD